MVRFMELLKRIFQKLFKKNEIKLIDKPKNIEKSEVTRNDFILSLRQDADLERDDRNGYRIIPNIKLKDMV